MAQFVNRNGRYPRRVVCRNHLTFNPWAGKIIPRPYSHTLTYTIHHLTVYAKVREDEQGGCTYGGYTLSTTNDRNGNPLIIEQIAKGRYNFLPFIMN